MDLNFNPKQIYNNLSKAWLRNHKYSTVRDFKKHGATFLVKSLQALDLNLREFSTRLTTQPTKKDFIEFDQKAVYDRLGLDINRRIQEKNDTHTIDLKNFCNYLRNLYLQSVKFRVMESFRDYLIEDRNTWLKLIHYCRPLNMLLCLQDDYVLELACNEDCVFDFFMGVLKEECRDSVTVVIFLLQLLSNSDYKGVIFLFSQAHIIDYMLVHVRNICCTLFGILSTPTYEYGNNVGNLINATIPVNVTDDIISVLADHNFPFEKVFVTAESGIPPEVGISFVPCQLKSRRKMFAIQVLNYYWMVKINIISLNEAIRGLQLIWDCIPDPYLISRELLVCIKETCLPEWRGSPEYKYSLVHVCFLYDKIAPNTITRPLQPRSLKHQCRYTIRKRLDRFGTLIVGPYVLPLPKELREYILLVSD